MSRPNKYRFAQELEHDTALRAYMRELDRYPRLSDAQVLDLARKVRAGGPDYLAHRNALVEAHLRMVIPTAKHFLGYGLSAIDVIQEGNLGLIAAADRYDPACGVSFSRYAFARIRKAYSEGIQRKAAAIRIPDRTYRRRNRVVRVTEDFYGRQHREPTDDELKALAHLSDAQLEAVRNAQIDMLSLDVEQGDTGDPLADTIADPEGDIDEAYIQHEERERFKTDLAIHMAALEPRAHRPALPLRLCGRRHLSGPRV
jgi:RNA polymerase sigma factor (sigma-70 family)